MSKTRAILLAGPTASGKTALAIALARALGGVIINADAMQVYRDLRVLTARPSADEERAAPHRLFGFVEAETVWSAGAWLRAAAAEIARARAEGLTPILVGGTGLYFLALIEGLAAAPPVPPEMRAELEAMALDMGPPHLHDLLARVDPAAAARIHENDAVRLIRALGVYGATGRPLSAFQAEPAEPVLAPGSFAAIALWPEREALYARIDQRFEAMIGAGALEEARALAARSLPPEATIRTAHGLPHLLAHIEGALTLEEAIHLGQRDTRRYAKRQRTFLRGRLSVFQRLETGEPAERLAAALALAREA